MIRKKRRRAAIPGHTIRLERLETRNLLAADMPMFQNPIEPMDVNDDGEITPVDALMVINRLRKEGREDGDRMFTDVNGDGILTPIDALVVINGINSGARARQHPPAPPEEQKPVVAGEIDGSNNNQEYTEWGAAHTQLLRITSVDYADGISEPAGQDRASPREISNLVAKQTESAPNERGLSDLVWQWGQFLDHDIDLTEGGEDNEELPIAVPAGDPLFDPTGSGEVTIPFTRSVYDETTGDSVDNPRQQVNAITSYIDGSNVYGSDEERAAALRTFAGGRLATSEGDLLPFNEKGLENAGGPSNALFLAGDIRANEQAGLAAMHTLWVREHNRLADEIAAADPSLTDEEIYQQARAILIAEMQAITYNEFLPALLGRKAIPEYSGYDESVNAGVSNMFSTAAYRFGHSMLSPELLRLDADGEVVEAGNLSLRDAFFNPTTLTENGIDSLLRGLAAQQAQEIDNQIIDDVRNFLFGPPGSGGFDLASLNIQRGRDHGLPDYNQVREELGLDPVTSFEDISSDPEVQAALEAAYGDVNNIDVWVGGLAEDHVRGGSVGELIQAVLADQFTRLRDGDRYWYENTFSGEQLREINGTTLADVIERNTDINGLQRNAFFVADARPNDGDRTGGRGGQDGRDGRDGRDRQRTPGDDLLARETQPGNAPGGPGEILASPPELAGAPDQPPPSATPRPEDRPHRNPVAETMPVDEFFAANVESIFAEFGAEGQI